MLDDNSDYLDAAFSSLRAAIRDLNDDHIIAIVRHVHLEMGRPAAQTVVAALLQTARSRLTDPVASACIRTAMSRYEAD